VIDLHCHILPGIDDGASDLAVSLEMARAFVDQGVQVVACTPHILPGLYHNSGPAIRQAVVDLQARLDAEAISLSLVAGADAHMCPDFIAGLRDGRLLTIGDSRYVLVEPPHHTAPPQLEDFFFKLLVAGYVPVLTHPERLSWVPGRYEVIERLAGAGVWMQLTAGSFIGAFGRNALYWAERMLAEGFVHIIATDAHDGRRRPPDLARARDAVAKQVGDEEAQHLVLTRPLGILNDQAPSSLPSPLRKADVEAGTAGRDFRQRSKGRSPGHRATAVGGDVGRVAGGLSGRLRRFFG
jgi:protein-tyrosine phosphatase